jgi:CysZ protein
MQPPTSPIPAPGPVRRAFAGVGFLRKGLSMWITSPRLMLIGAIPALIVGAVYVVGIVFLAINLNSIAEWVTPFAADWAAPWRTAVRVAVAVAVVLGSIVLLSYTYVAVTLLVGDPFYERIWRTVENRLGDAPPDSSTGIVRSALRALADALRLLAPVVLVGLAIMVCGLIPVVGGLMAFTLGALFGGWILALELTGLAFDVRGYTLRQRRGLLASQRATSLGFGVATYLLFLIPFAAIFVMPAAVAGAALLSRDTLSRLTEEAPV